ncbi:MAG: KEOPS complex subunit Pcc1 [Candidatus Bathyarchaeota archaeon]|nr:KEOPS complex subunit Pcc1 [Candidatus Bathyarchaeota archaeon]
MEATIILEYSDAKIADAIANAVSPDNFTTPSGLLIRTVKKDKRVLTEIKANGKLLTFIATINDLLFCVSTAEKTLCTVTKAHLE